MVKKQYDNVLDKIAIKYSIEYENRDNASQIIGIIKDNKLSSRLFGIYPEILNLKPTKVANVVKEFVDLKLPMEILEKNPQIFEKTTASRIKKVGEFFKGLKKGEEILVKNSDILSVGKVENIEEILDIFSKISVDQKYFIENGLILAYGDAGNIKKVIKVLEKYSLLKVVLKKAPEVFYNNNASIIEDILELYNQKENGFSLSIISKYPQILSNTTKVRISAIINMLERNKIDAKILVKKPEIVYTNDTKDIENIINQLKERDIQKEQIMQYPEVLLLNELGLSKLVRKIDYMLEYPDIYDMQDFNLKILLSANMQSLVEFTEHIQNGKLPKEIVSLCPSIVVKTTPLKVEKVLGLLKEVGMEKYYVTNPQILEIENPEKIKDIYDVIVKYDIDPQILSNVQIFIQGDAQNIDDILKILKDSNYDLSSINSALLIKGDGKNIQSVLDYLQKGDLLDGEMPLKKSSTILVDGDRENIESVKQFLASKNLLDNPEVEIPGIVFAKGKVEVMEKIYNFFKKYNLLNQLKSAMSLLSRPYYNIKTNMDILLEHDMLDEILTNISVLGLSSETIEKRLNFLEENGIEKKVAYLKLTNDKFTKKFNTTQQQVDKDDQKYLGQEIVESKYSQYLNESAKALPKEYDGIFEKVYTNIQELGNLKHNLEYTKCGYTYSNIKIRENILKILSNAANDIDLNDLTNKDYIYITVLSILGNKKVSEQEAERICVSVINNEQEPKPTSSITIAQDFDSELDEELDQTLEDLDEITKDIADLDDIQLDDEFDLEDQETEDDVKVVNINEIDEEEIELPNIKSLETDFFQDSNIDGDTPLKSATAASLTSIYTKVSQMEGKSVNLKDYNFDDDIDLDDELEDDDYISEFDDLVDLNEEDDFEKQLEQGDVEVYGINQKEDVIAKARQASKTSLKAKKDLVEKQKLLKQQEDLAKQELELKIQNEKENLEILQMKQNLEQIQKTIQKLSENVQTKKDDYNKMNRDQEKQRVEEILRRRQEKENELLKRKVEELEKEREKLKEKELEKNIKEEAAKLVQEEIRKVKEDLEKKQELERQELLRQKEMLLLELQKQQAEQEKGIVSNQQAPVSKPKINLEEQLEQKEQEPKQEKVDIQTVKQTQEYIHQELENDLANDIEKNLQKEIDKRIPKQNTNNQSNYVQYDPITGKAIVKPSHIDSQKFETTLNAIYNPEKKAFFGIDDYGYILSKTNPQDQEIIRKEINMLYKQEKEKKERQKRNFDSNYYD